MESKDAYTSKEYREPPNYPSGHHPAPPTSSSSTAASPFAFAPPPLPINSVSNSFRSQMYLSDPPTGSYPKSMVQPSSYPYSSAPMGFRSYSSESGAPPPHKTSSNSPASLAGRTPNMDIAMGSPLNSSFSSPYAYGGGRQVSSQSPYASNLSLPSPQPRPGAYPYMQAPDMPRSLTYPSYAQPYASPSAYHPSLSTPSLPTQSGLRHESSGAGPIRQPMGYSFANRLPLVDKPFKCDECVQSFNRNHDLKRHKRIHLAVKPFGCEKCGKTFSRKDALRRHWLVKGCRGDEGATAPIVPMFPITGAAVRNARPTSPPTPPGHITPPETATSASYPHPSGSYSMNRPDVPPLLNTLPSRTPSVRSGMSQVILTPNDIGPNASLSRQQQMPGGGGSIHLEDPIVIEPSMGSSSTPPTGESGQSGYFDMNLKSGSDSNMLNAPILSPGQQHAQYSNNNRSYSSLNSPATRPSHHPYRRSNNPNTSPVKLSPRTSTTLSPTTGYAPGQRTYSGEAGAPSIGPDGKSAFAVPFTPDYQSSANGDMLNVSHPPGTGHSSGSPAEGMSRQSSGDSDPSTWQRWHRPSFPFPHSSAGTGPNSSSYQSYDNSPPLEMTSASYSQ
ncbi:hypothetical protein BD324DRAFT_608862 [Kockovaella imperatae]|uniref:C2H2-type domain-containing protein n=1 Tax=Kockovaella imperatae TaxID=4999 RepID=A0A1Y1UFN4_9TREE|nr:hypothetical protein BD324DRAFT_608862 [Kockovaella imperatae]ORX36863.1 hypothetical protein BD324DRAFT_608862 [Kockovaella imperatae]